MQPVIYVQIGVRDSKYGIVGDYLYVKWPIRFFPQKSLNRANINVFICCLNVSRQVVPQGIPHRQISHRESPSGWDIGRPEVVGWQIKTVAMMRCWRPVGVDDSSLQGQPWFKLARLGLWAGSCLMPDYIHQMNCVNCLNDSVMTTASETLSQILLHLSLLLSLLLLLLHRYQSTCIKHSNYQQHITHTATNALWITMDKTSTKPKRHLDAYLGERCNCWCSDKDDEWCIFSSSQDLQRLQPQTTAPVVHIIQQCATVHGIYQGLAYTLCLKYISEVSCNVFLRHSIFPLVKRLLTDFIQWSVFNAMATFVRHQVWHAASTQDCFSIKGRPPGNAFLLMWPWTWPNDLDIKT